MKLSPLAAWFRDVLPDTSTPDKKGYVFRSLSPAVLGFAW